MPKKKAKIGRPPTVKPELKKLRKSLSLTQMQWDCLAVKAEFVGMSVSAYIERQLFGNPSGRLRTRAKELRNKKQLGLL